MTSLLFPPSVEIKRAIAAAERTGIQISSIEIHPRKIIIIAINPADKEPKQQTYSEWKVVPKSNGGYLTSKLVAFIQHLVLAHHKILRVVPFTYNLIWNCR